MTCFQGTVCEFQWLTRSTGISFISNYDSHRAQTFMIFIDWDYLCVEVTCSKWKFSASIKLHEKVRNSLDVPPKSWEQVCTDTDVAGSQFRSTDGAVLSLNWVHLLLTGRERVELVENGMVRHQKRCVITWRETYRLTQQSAICGSTPLWTRWIIHASADTVTLIPLGGDRGCDSRGWKQHAHI